MPMEIIMQSETYRVARVSIDLLLEHVDCAITIRRAERDRVRETEEGGDGRGDNVGEG